MFDFVVHAFIKIVDRNGDEILFSLDFRPYDLTPIEDIINKHITDNELADDFMIKSIEF